MLVNASQISKGQLSDMNTLSSLLFTTNFFLRASVPESY